MTRKERILREIERRPGLSDREITNAIDGRDRPQQPINIACRDLEKHGTIKRIRRPDGIIGNYLKTHSQANTVTVTSPPAPTANDANLSEDEVKKHLSTWLKNAGWNVRVAWGKSRGVDIEATRKDERWLIEVKGCGSRSEMRVNYFIGMLGELLQRMDDPKARYSIATPDMRQFHGLWTRLPALAKQRLELSMLFVSANGAVKEHTV